MLLLCETHPYVLILTHRTRFWSLGINISTFEKNHFLVFFTFFEFVGFPSKNSSEKNLKKSNFQFWIFRWIRPIFMFYKRENMSFSHLDVFLNIWYTYLGPLWEKRDFWPQMSIFCSFQKFHLWVFCRNIEGRRNFDRQNSRKKSWECSWPPL